MLFAIIIFWVLLIKGLPEIGLKGALIFILIWGVLFTGVGLAIIPGIVFSVSQVILDIILILIVVGGDIRIR